MYRFLKINLWVWFQELLERDLFISVGRKLLTEQRKMLLILDLDYTLVHTIQRKNLKVTRLFRC